MLEFRSLTDVVQRAQARVLKLSAITLYRPERMLLAEWYQADLTVVGRNLGAAGAQSYQCSVLFFVLCRMCDEVDDIRWRKRSITACCYLGIVFSVITTPFPASSLPALWFILAMHYGLGLAEKRLVSLVENFQVTLKRLRTGLSISNSEVVVETRGLISASPRATQLWRLIDGVEVVRDRHLEVLS